ncbi:MAG: hypothetical protein JXA69_19915, partial [Phycisphaerae bacterium]|nr:hypothetical protein [Phycisphaerae bacterium]
TASKSGYPDAVTTANVEIGVVTGNMYERDLMLGELPGVSADFDGDDDVDMTDFGLFQMCFNGPNRAPAENDCDAPDLDGDGDVDMTDFGVFQACFNGPNRPPAAGCP